MKMNWDGVLPAMTTCFDAELKIDHAFMARHANWLVDSGCTGIVSLGSLGEATTLSFDEKIAILGNMVACVRGRAPVVAAISALSTGEAVALAKTAADTGCEGLMVLPPYVYLGDWRETKAHVAAIFRATPLSCMLYNNPNLHAVKESSTDVRRVAAIRAIDDSRLRILVGVDDAIVEGVAVGATGWIAGLVNAFPVESVALFDYATQGRTKEAFDLYRWFLPLLRMDTVPKFIQLIKLVQQEVGEGYARVRPPRLELAGDELSAARAVIQSAIKSRPTLLAKA
jgi:4-hydroxy-tetrahydrodipicolinate synthase